MLVLRPGAVKCTKCLRTCVVAAAVLSFSLGVFSYFRQPVSRKSLESLLGLEIPLTLKEAEERVGSEWSAQCRQRKWEGHFPATATACPGPILASPTGFSLPLWLRRFTLLSDERKLVLLVAEVVSCQPDSSDRDCQSLYDLLASHMASRYGRPYKVVPTSLDRWLSRWKSWKGNGYRHLRWKDVNGNRLALSLDSDTSDRILVMLYNEPELEAERLDGVIPDPDR